MAKGYESSITLWENNGWWGTEVSDPIVPLVNSEGLSRTLILQERNTMVRSTRSILEDSLVWSESKPEGNLSITPRLEDALPMLYSHFQMRDPYASGSTYEETFIPSKYPPIYDSVEYGTGTYGSPSGAVYSIDVWRKIADADPDHGYESQWNTEKFSRGICNKLTFSMNANEDFELAGEFKFKDYAGTSWGSNPGDSGAGDYSLGSISDWSHGTWSIENNDISDSDVIPGGLSSISIECSNNITEKKTLGASSRQVFDFGNYTVKGQFTTEWISDYFQEDLEDFSGPYFLSIAGTVYHSDTEYMTISMPRVRIKPFENKLGKPQEFAEVEIPFEAYEYQGTSPITVIVNSESQIVEPKFTNWDAEYGARTIGLYDLADAGSTSRVLIDYDFADRKA